MKETCFLLFLCYVLCSCAEDPEFSVLEKHSIGFYLDGINEFLADEEITVRLYYFGTREEEVIDDSVRLEFELIGGGGSIIPSKYYLSSGEEMDAVWQFGSGSFKQVLRAKIFDSDGNYLTFADKTIYGFRVNEWDQVFNRPESKIRDLLADTIQNISYMISNNFLYKQGDRYYKWKRLGVPSPKAFGKPANIEMDGSGVLYISTTEGEIIKSTNSGENWEACTKPYSNIDHYIYFYISNDNSLWAHTFDKPLMCSRDRGLSWTEAGTGLGGGVLGDIFSLSNGDLIFHGTDCCSMYLSKDDGLSWTHVPTPGLSVKLFVAEDDKIIIVTQEDGISFYLSDDYGSSFTFLRSVSPRFGTSFNDVFIRWKDFYYIFIPGYGILKSDDLYKYDHFQLLMNARELFIDHNGVLIAKDRDFESVHYFNPQE